MSFTRIRLPLAVIGTLVDIFIRIVLAFVVAWKRRKARRISDRMMRDLMMGTGSLGG